MQEWALPSCGCALGFSNVELWAKYKPCPLHHYANDLRDALKSLLETLVPENIPDNLVAIIANAKDVLEKTKPEEPFEPPLGAEP